jgi:hypothetical protein
MKKNFADTSSMESTRVQCTKAESKGQGHESMTALATTSQGCQPLR